MKLTKILNYSTTPRKYYIIQRNVLKKLIYNVEIKFKVFLTPHLWMRIANKGLKSLKLV